MTAKSEAAQIVKHLSRAEAQGLCMFLHGYITNGFGEPEASRLLASYLARVEENPPPKDAPT